jgi:hypothetical protein
VSESILASIESGEFPEDKCNVAVPVEGSGRHRWPLWSKKHVAVNGVNIPRCSNAA